MAAARKRKPSRKRKKGPKPPRCLPRAKYKPKRIRKKVRGRKKTVIRCVPRKKPKRAGVPVGTPPAAQLPPGPVGLPVPPAPPQTAPPSTPVPTGVIPIYDGQFGAREAQRLLWRAGFGPLPGEAESLAAKGVRAAVMTLTRPSGPPVLHGPEPVAPGGGPLTPTDRDGHDHLYWLDRMVRSDQQLVERMALIYHDWFATSKMFGIAQHMMLVQTNLFRKYAFGSFKALVREITMDPAMILWLNQDMNARTRILENYSRELMELFTLGADRGAYTENDVRELAKALAGWHRDYSPELGFHNFRYVPARRELGPKTIFGKTGDFEWEDACRMVIEHPMHPSFFVEKLWSYFISPKPSAADQRALEKLYVDSGYAARPVLEAILCSRAFYESEPMVKPPTVLVAGMLRYRQRAMKSESWDQTCQEAGQRLYLPPDVGGWDHSRWLDSNTMRGRWGATHQMMQPYVIQQAQSSSYPANETPEQAVREALNFWGDPPITEKSRQELLAFSRAVVPTTTPDAWRRARRQNGLRQLVAASPDFQTC